MKKKYILLLLSIFAPILLNAQNFIDNNIHYSVTDATNFYVTVADNQAYALASAVIPESVIYNTQSYTVTAIKDFAFAGSALTSVTIPNTVETILNDAFANCTSLSNVSIGNSVTSIGKGTFYNCTSLTSITIPDSVAAIEFDTFSQCTNLSSVSLGNSINAIGYGAFYNCTSLASIVIPNSVLDIQYNAFYNCILLSAVSIGNSVATIGDSAFYNCESLTSLTIPNSVLTIGNSTFSECSGIVNVSVGNSVTDIGTGSFYNCLGLTSIVFPDSLISLGSTSFFACTSLASVSFGNAIATIGNQSFAWCTSLLNVSIAKIVPPVINSNVFEGLVLSGKTLSVPSVSEAVYQIAPVWEDFNITTLGLTNSELALLKVYPNPTIDSIHLDIPKNLRLKFVSVYNLNGQLLVKTSTNQLDLGSFLEGEYFIHIETEQGSALKKIIKVSSK